MALKGFDKGKLAEYVSANPELAKTAGTREEHGGHGSHGGHDGHGRQLHHMYVPMQQKDHMIEGGKKVPVHNLHVNTRAKFMSDLVNSDFRGGGLGIAYRAYFWAIIAFVATILTYSISIYIAAVFAYATGWLWSRRLVEPPWNITWFKGKALYYTK